LNQKAIQHTCTVYQLSSDKRHTSRHELDDGHTWGKTVGGVIGWSPRILGADITILQNFLFKFPFPKPDYAEMKSLPANLLYCIACYCCLNYFKL